MPVSTHLAKPALSQKPLVATQHPIVLRFIGLTTATLPRFVMHDGRRGGDLAHVDATASSANRILHGEKGWDIEFKQRVEAVRVANHQEQIRAQHAKHRIKEVKRLKHDGPSDPWRPSKEGPLREGILTVNKFFFGGTGRDAWDMDCVETFKARALEFMKEHFPDGQLLYASGHADEEAFHIHFVVATWTETISANRGRQVLLQPSANPLIANYEHAQDMAGAAFADLGLRRGERHAAARRAARLAGEEMPPVRRHVPPSQWRREELRKGRAAAERVVADATTAAEAVSASARPDAEKMVRKSRKRAIKEARRRRAAADRDETACRLRLAQARRELAKTEAARDKTEARVSEVTRQAEAIIDKAETAVATKTVEFTDLKEKVRAERDTLAQLTEEKQQRETDVGGLTRRYNGLKLGLQLLEDRQIAWLPLQPEGPRELVWVKRDGTPAPLPKSIRATLEPATSLLELIMELIRAILDAFFGERELDLIEDAKLVQTARQGVGFAPDMTIEEFFARRSDTMSPDM